MNVIGVAAKWVPIAFIAYFAKDAVVALAGKTTKANLIVAYLTESDSGNAVTIFALLALGTTIWALRERKLRQDAIERLTARTTILEKMIDANRSSSGLTSTGKTNPRDQ